MISRLRTHLPFLLALTALLFLCLAKVAFAQASPGEVDEGSVFAEGIKDILWTVVNNFFGWMVGVAGVLLNFSVNTFVVGFGDIFLGAGGFGTIGAAVDLAWVAVRDIFNLTFIFGLVYIGFKMILNSDDANTRRWLVNLIMAALLVNFSLFITKFIVDFSNILATQIVNVFPPHPVHAGQAGISNAFMEAFNIETVWNGEWINEYEGPAQGEYAYIFGTAIIFLITAFVFAAGALLLIIRFIALCLYMVMSPLMFLGWVFPQLSSVTRQYWSGFLGRAFYAPVYILMLYFSLLILGAVPQGNLALSLAGREVEQGVETALVTFILGAGFLIGSIVVASKMSVDGAATAIRVGNYARSRVQRGVQRTAYSASRGTARGTYESGKYFGGRRASYALGSQLERQINRMQQSNNKLVRGAARSRTVDEQGRKAAASMKNVTAFGTTREQDQQYANKVNERADRGRDAIQQFDLAMSGDKDAMAKLSGLISKMSDDEMKQFTETLFSRDANNPAIRNLFSSKSTDPEVIRARELVAANMSDQQIKALQESGRYTNEDVKEMKNARERGTFNPLIETLDKGAETTEKLGDTLGQLSRSIKSLSGDRLTRLANADDPNGMSLLNPRFAANLSEKQLDTVRESVAPEKFQEIKKARDEGFQRIANTGSLASSAAVGATAANQYGTTVEARDKAEEFKDRQREALFQQSAQDAGKLPADVYANEKMRPFISLPALQQRVRNGMTAAQQQEIQDNLQKHIDTLKEQQAEKYIKWTENTTEGSNFELKNTAKEARIARETAEASRKQAEEAARKAAEKEAAEKAEAEKKRPTVLGPDGRPVNK